MIGFHRESFYLGMVAGTLMNERTTKRKIKKLVNELQHESQPVNWPEPEHGNFADLIPARPFMHRRKP